MRYPAIIALCLATVTSQAHGKIGSPQHTPPSWIDAKWTASDAEYAPIRATVEKLWLSGPTDHKKLRALYEANVGRRHVDQSVGRKEQLKARFWFLALYAYFPDEQETFDRALQFGGKPFLEEWDVPPSYEFTRVAHFVYRKTAEYRRPSRDLYERLLKKDSKDYLARWYRFPGDNARYFAFAKELYDELPKKRRLFRGNLVLTSINEYGRTKNPKFLHLANQLVNDVLSGRDPLGTQHKKPWLVQKQRIEDMARKAGIKL